MTLTAAEFMGAGPAPLNGSSAWAILRLPSGHTALIDAADLPYVSQFKWHVLKAPHTVYVQTHGSPANGRSRTYLHRLLLAAEPGQQVDHRNRNGLDNRRCNLRLCTRSQNLANQQPQINNSSGYRGVSLHDNNGTNPWRARLCVEGKAYHLGYFADAWEAAQAYNAAARDIWGEFALLNERLP